MNKTIAFLFVTLFIPTLLFSQETVNKEDTTKIKRAPIYPGCIGDDNEALKKCMRAKIQILVNKSFRTHVIDEQKLKDSIYKININIKFTKKGRVEIMDIVAPSEAIKKETIRVIKKIKRVKPGTIDGEPVGTLYTFPITLKKG